MLNCLASRLPVYQVKCSLQFWCVEERCFSTLLSFYVSETAPSEHTLLSSDTTAAAQSATVWRVAIVECVASENEDEVFSSKYVCAVHLQSYIYVHLYTP